MAGKETILATIEDLCSDFLYYDRKEDEELSAEELISSVRSGEISVDEMVEEFRKHLNNTFKSEPNAQTCDATAEKSRN